MSLQVIEHLTDVSGYLSEIRRVLSPGGAAVLATPNRITFSPNGGVGCRYHTVEYSYAELIQVCERFFGSVTVYALYTVGGLPGVKNPARLLDYLLRQRQGREFFRAVLTKMTWKACGKNLMKLKGSSLTDFIISPLVDESRALDWVAVLRKTT